MAETRGEVGAGQHDSDLEQSKRLTILVTSTQRRGAEVFGERLSEELPRLGWVVEFLALGAPRTGSSFVKATPLSPNPVARLDPVVIRRLRERLRAHGTDVVLANGSSTLHYGVAAVRTMRHRPRLVYSSIGEPSYWANSARRRQTYRAFLSMVDQVFSVSGPTASQLSERFGVPRARIRVLPTGVPDDIFQVAEPGTHDGLRILFMGSLSSEKDPLAALAVVERVLSSTPAMLRVVGAGPLREAVERAASDAGIDHAVELLGSVADVKPHLQWADVLLLTSRTEGLPAATLEAAAAGRPAVAFNVGGVSETIEDGATGYLIEPGDLEGAAHALRTYADDPNGRNEAGRAARARALRLFTMEAAVSRYDRALTELATGESRR